MLDSVRAAVGSPARQVLLVTVLAAALRLHGLDRQSLWNDELSTWSKFRQPTWQQVVAVNTSDVHPPGHVVFMHFWTRALGDSETALRLPSAIAGIAVIPAMFALGRRLYGPAEGLIAAAITAVAEVPIFYSQEVRAYMMLLLVVVLSSSWLIDIVRALDEGRAPPAGATVGYAVAAEVACYLHYYGLFFVGLQALAAGLMVRRRPAALLALAAIDGAVLLGYLPWLREAGIDIATGPGWTKPPRLLAPLGVIKWLFNGFRPTILVLVLWAILLVQAVVRRGVRAFASTTDALLVAWLVVPVAIVFVKSLVGTPAFGYRYFIILVPAAYLLTARAVTQLPVRRSIRLVVAAGLPAMLLVHLVVVARYYARPNKEQFREAAAYLVRGDAPGAKALVLATAWRDDYFDYYFARLGSARRVDRLAEKAEDGAAIAALVAERAPDDVWLVAGHKKPSPELIAWLEKDLRLVDQAHFYGADVWRFAPRRGG